MVVLQLINRMPKQSILQVFFLNSKKKNVGKNSGQKVSQWKDFKQYIVEDFLTTKIFLKALKNPIYRRSQSESPQK